MNKIKGILLTVLSAMTFGFAFTLAPMTYGAEGGNPVMLTFLRNSICLPVLLVILLLKKESLKVTKSEALKLFILGSIGMTLTNLLLNMAFQMIDVGIVTTLHFVYPIFVTLGCAVFFKEKLSLKKGIALVLVCIGVISFILGPGAQGSGSLAGGVIVALMSGLTYAFYMIFMDKSGLKKMEPFKATFYLALTVSVWMLLYGSLTEQLDFSILTPKAWGISTVFSILCSVLALSMIQVGIRHVGASTAAILSTFEPVTSIVFGCLLLGEEMNLFKVIGCVFIFGGVLAISLEGKSNVQPENNLSETEEKS